MTVTSVFSLDEIVAALPDVDVVSEVEAGFAAFSRGEVTVPPVGELLFPDVHGEMHIKYGAVRGDDVFVIKVATGFFGNPALGLPPFGGCMLVLSQKTGMVEAVLLEEGELTNHRTAAAGAVAAKHLAPKNVGCIGIIGSGVQARLQADYLRRVAPCRRLMIWGRRDASRSAAARDIAAMGYAVEEAGSPDDVARHCRLIVTTTPAETAASAAMCRKAPRMLMSPLAPDTNSQAVMLFTRMPTPATTITVFPATGAGSPKRWMASHPMAPTATRRNTALKSDARIDEPFIPYV